MQWPNPDGGPGRVLARARSGQVGQNCQVKQSPNGVQAVRGNPKSPLGGATLAPAGAHVPLAVLSSSPTSKDVLQSLSTQQGHAVDALLQQQECIIMEKVERHLKRFEQHISEELERRMEECVCRVLDVMISEPCERALAWHGQACKQVLTHVLQTPPPRATTPAATGLNRDSSLGDLKVMEKENSPLLCKARSSLVLVPQNGTVFKPPQTCSPKIPDALWEECTSRRPSNLSNASEENQQWLSARLVPAPEQLQSPSEARTRNKKVSLYEWYKSTSPKAEIEATGNTEHNVIAPLNLPQDCPNVEVFSIHSGRPQSLTCSSDIGSPS